MIRLREQYGFNSQVSEVQLDKYASILGNQLFTKAIQRGDNKAFCFKIYPLGEGFTTYRAETSYFVGVDWVVENKLPISVRPKLDDENSEVNYLKMLFDALKEPENIYHLDELYEIDFKKPSISISQSEDFLTPLLLIQYINILKRIVQKGLRKSYYTVSKNLNAKIKGKLLINDTIRKNHFKIKMTYSYCQYSEFGINSTENKLLKKALDFSISAIQHFKIGELLPLKSHLNFIQPVFQQVDSDVNIEDLKFAHPSPLYKEYEQALKLAKYILRRYGYNISNATSTIVSTPPFWIDMSKLFELYVYSKLRERFSHHAEVTYHKKFNYLEPDFIVKTNDGSIKMVVDAKYKPQYKDGKISTEDIRQISGYARLHKVYSYLEADVNNVIDCLVIYSNQMSNRKDFKGDNFNFQEESGYNRFYKIGIELPVKTISI